MNCSEDKRPPLQLLPGRDWIVSVCNRRGTIPPWAFVEKCFRTKFSLLPNSLHGAEPFLRNSNILRNQEVYYYANKSLSLVPILSQMNQIQATHPIFLRFTLILSSNVRLAIPSCLFPYGFPTNILYGFVLTQCVLHAICISSSLA
jgi:hypothetical protein